MQVYFDILPQESNTAVALGYFDGIHIGHRRVLSSACAESAGGLSPVCFTFSKSPKAVLGFAQGGELMTNDDKLSALNSLGIKFVYQADFESVMNMSAVDFFEEILVKRLRAKELFCGFNYHFGKNGEGDTELLSRLCSRAGVGLCVVPPTQSDGRVVSSTLIKALVSDGKIADANKLLGSYFGFAERIEHGRRLGRELGTPTLNQPLKPELVVPKFGVYCSAVTLESGEVFCGVTNVGVKPTVGSEVALCETWMPEYHGKEIYGQMVDVRLLDFIRPEQRFGSLDELKNMIIDNGKTAVEIFSKMYNKTKF